MGWDQVFTTPLAKANNYGSSGAAESSLLQWLGICWKFVSVGVIEFWGNVFIYLICRACLKGWSFVTSNETRVYSLWDYQPMESQLWGLVFSGMSETVIETVLHSHTIQNYDGVLVKVIMTFVSKSWDAWRRRRNLSQACINEKPLRDHEPSEVIIVYFNRVSPMSV